ncbi:ABC transporter ATP-binding protein [Neomegalonema perideroedes]|uniref:ABC transporter ATP-binding protein n=1 Tax=Neomegalonema perideroedes TaxID=217219 RepID=UPI000373B256|nr:ABC transporter ATP-binding protein [Neomegalonema perideroedes]
MTAPLFLCRGLTATYPEAGRPALKGVSLEMAPGERLALIGESGSGKSTLARILAGLPPEGARVEGEILRPGGELRLGRDVGYVFQDPGGSLDPLLSVGGHFTETLRSHLPLSGQEALDRAAGLLAKVRIPDPEAALRSYPHRFSGGQRQRIAIALAMAPGPRLLVADEATSALDALVQAEIVALLRGLSEGEGLALLFVTHDMGLAAGLADRIAVLHEGRLVEIGPARRVIETPQDPYTRRLLAAHLGLESPRLVGEAP